MKSYVSSMAVISCVDLGRRKDAYYGIVLGLAIVLAAAAAISTDRSLSNILGDAGFGFFQDRHQLIIHPSLQLLAFFAAYKSTGLANLMTVQPLAMCLRSRGRSMCQLSRTDLGRPANKRARDLDKY